MYRIIVVGGVEEAVYHEDRSVLIFSSWTQVMESTLVRGRLCGIVFYICREFVAAMDLYG